MYLSHRMLIANDIHHDRFGFEISVLRENLKVKQEE